MNQDFVLNLKVRGDSAQAEASLARVEGALGRADRAVAQLNATSTTAARTSAGQAQAQDAVAGAHRRGARATDIGARAVNDYGVSVGQTRQAMRQLPAQITDIVTSLAGGQKPWLVAIQQGGQLKDSFGGVVPAARALLGAITPLAVGVGLAAAVIGGLAVATLQGYREMQGYERALIASGNAAATTAGQLGVIQDTVGAATGEYADAQTALTALAASGQVAGDTLQLAASAAVNLSQLTGESIEQTTQKVAALAAAPAAQLITLNQQYRFLSVEVYQHVRALEAQGRAQDAARLAIEHFARTSEQRLQEAITRAGSLERAWRHLGTIIGGVWDTIKNIGRDDLAFRLSKTTQALNRIGNEWRELGGINSLDAVLASRDVDAGTKDRIRALRQEQTALQREANVEQAKAGAQAAVQARQTAGINALGRAREALGQDRAVAKAQQLKQLERDIALFRSTGVKHVEGLPVDTYERRRRAQIDEQFKAPKGPRAAKPKATDADRAREDAERELASLRREVVLLGEVEAGQTRAGDAARIRYETTQGALAKIAPALKAQLLAEAESLDKARAAQEAERERKAAIEKTTRAYDALRDGLRTPAEVALETATEQVKVLNDALRDGIATKDAYDAALARVAKDSFRKPDAIPGATPDQSEAAGEFAQIEQSRVRLQAWHAEQLALLAQFRAQRADLGRQWDAQELAIEQQHQAALAQLQTAQTQVLLSGASAAFGQLAGIARQYGGEQSKTYRALFALSKAFAIAQAAIALANNVSEASKYGFPQNIPFIIGAIAQGATIAGLIAQANFSGGGGYAGGGHVRGHVRGAGTSTSDSIVARLSDFEFVTRAAVVRQPGALTFLEDFNARGMPALDAWHARRFAGAAPPQVSLPRAPRVNFADGGLARAAGGLTPQLNLRLVNAIDTEALAASIATSRSMETTVLNIIDRNGNFLRQKVGG